MPKVDIYTSPLCGFCHAAKRLLTKKGVDFNEINVMLSPEKRREMIDRAGGGHSVPQIFIGETHVGGCDELFDLEFDDELDPLLQDASPGKV